MQSNLVSFVDLVELGALISSCDAEYISDSSSVFESSACDATGAASSLPSPSCGWQVMLLMVVVAVDATFSGHGSRPSSFGEGGGKAVVAVLAVAVPTND